MSRVCDSIIVHFAGQALHWALSALAVPAVCAPAAPLCTNSDPTYDVPGMPAHLQALLQAQRGLQVAPTRGLGSRRIIRVSQ